MTTEVAADHSSRGFRWFRTGRARPLSTGGSVGADDERGSTMAGERGVGPSVPGNSKIPTCVSAGRRLCSPAKSYVARGGVEPPTFRFSVGRSYQLSYLAVTDPANAARWRGVSAAVLTGLEPATSALTGRRALQLLHRTLLCAPACAGRAPNGIRTRATALKGRRPGPLDDEGGPAIIAHSQLQADLLPSGPAGGLRKHT